MRQTGLSATFSSLRSALAVAMLASLAACAGNSGKHVEAVHEAAEYQARASSNYSVPGDPADPWGPYVTEASKRFDVPERWIREVMRQESGGQLFHNGGLTTSPVGAMGLMQVMPSTYDMLKAQYGLGEDPYDPHNNILAGTAYIRQMYDLYGSPGFLAAYNAGPARVDDFLTHNRPLPAETRHYVASIGPYIRDSFPVSRSPVEDYKLAAAQRTPIDNTPPVETASAPMAEPAAAPVEDRDQAPRLQMAMAETLARVSERHRTAQAQPPAQPASQPVEVAELPDHPRGTHLPYEPISFTPPVPTRPSGGGLHLISSAMASELPMRHEEEHNGAWTVQVGAFDTAKKAEAAAKAAKVSHSGRVVVGTVTQGHSIFYRARLTDMSHQEASATCARHKNCMIIGPGRS